MGFALPVRATADADSAPRHERRSSGAVMSLATTADCYAGISTTLRHLRHGLVGLAAALLAACGGGDGDGSGGGNQNPPPPPPAACTDCGSAVITMTDAQGDFLSYTVDVTSVKLKKANGTTVETLPAT